MQNNQNQEKNQSELKVDDLIRRIVYQELDKVQVQSAEEVIKEMNSVIDELISKKIKEHFKEISEYILTKTKEG